MPPFRNFLKRPTVTVEPAIDETRQSQEAQTGKSEGGSQRPSLSIRRSRDGDPNEYKMSVVNDSGVYLPPSPPEKRGFWGSPSRNNSRSLVNENEPFSISRESFDSYRRSFDVSARSPVSQTDVPASRTSLDSRLARPNQNQLSPHSGTERRLASRQAAVDDAPFEDVRLTDDSKPKKKGLFSRFADSSTDNSGSSTTQHHGFHFPGRKRGQSGQGAELRDIANSGSPEVKS